MEGKLKIDVFELLIIRCIKDIVPPGYSLATHYEIKI